MGSVLVLTGVLIGWIVAKRSNYCGSTIGNLNVCEICGGSKGMDARRPQGPFFPKLAEA
jgi:hypothetical protein